MSLRATELDATTFPAFRDAILEHDADPALPEPRTYPGYPRVALESVRLRRFARLDGALVARRSPRRLGEALPSRKDLSRILRLGHGVTGAPGHARGPVPSAGGLQALELYVAPLDSGWLSPGVYHYDRAGHFLSLVGAGASREAWRALVPSMRTLEGGAVLFLVVGDLARVHAKYGARADRFLLVEAGHLLQNLCLLAVSLGLALVPMGGVLEPEVGRVLSLPRSDAVLYAGVCGAPG
jgi:SagB-type dehydrogenase family enzyme